jgi:hypothetical protein
MSLRASKSIGVAADGLVPSHPVTRAANRGNNFKGVAGEDGPTFGAPGVEFLARLELMTTIDSQVAAKIRDVKDGPAKALILWTEAAFRNINCRNPRFHNL